MIIIKKIKHTDKEAILFVHKQSIYGICRDYYTEEEIEAWTASLTPEIFDEGIKNQDNVGVAAVDSNKVVGYCFFNVPDKELKALYLLPGYIKQGVGKMLLFQLEEIAKEKNITKLVLKSTINAVGFYQRFGYKKIKEDKFFINENISLDCIYMEKKLI
ncbi:MAG: GNAT family N-acetyltransferase [Candidatus Aminicenantes bacterium]|nr:GNAT family N-acetyltransferase [Candidatus Aminicenantes bacterium]